MKKKITNIYAKVFYLFWLENPKFLEELALFAETLKENETLQKIVFYNTVSKTERKNVLSEILSKLLNEQIVIGYVLYLNENKRLIFIFEIFEEIKKLIFLHEGFRKVQIEGTSDYLEKRVLEIFKNIIKRYYPEKLEIEYFKRNNITAGYRAHVEDFLLDLTLDTQFEKLLKRRKLT
ncbi:MAG: hypothetical protein A2381_09045 [Bdellovibrionales bacterium RIFOXYB1_FULL_37_110]|nr:MAG: hypothetical protein A2181_09235 [Bdellovibrionales bacterium RIFOXYA1_FULL_38_20]OFZ46417.1 MAG: hypothetical protein A2417_09145 [Bdellovibrionales bacterium RIFOXYC1_FULL_37_79]OFZ60981.1 MAG: hypothetical protein A2381_09045 [Bdellovibrionales bacterium RIFOXYB1_FULL_37_110]OFZ63725.1 MAG: hypothetical protein A2577_08165 [Bdellovibrionales bacterium RIFOXYD1_FULL_36_51]OFZ65799.1 MAG: hypothetical protein A2328_05170 [Bdellovibrionales bacterium RIFOXYB2_FULL_36_6]